MSSRRRTGRAVADVPPLPAMSDVSAFADALLAVYGIEPGVVQSLTLGLEASGVQVVTVRLLLTQAALDAIRAQP
jgi:hypothetical protein